MTEPHAADCPAGDGGASTGKRADFREEVLPAKLRGWRERLRQKAKGEKNYRFYSLYGLVCEGETLREAWRRTRANGGAPGVDGTSIEQVEQNGVEAFLESLRLELVAKTYRASPVRRVYIPKSNGKLRPLGIPTVRDRVVQTAVLLILEPIFESDFLECSHGFRPGRNAHQALRVIREQVGAGRCEVYDADLEGYFDSIPHDQLILCVRMRVVDGSVLRLLREWLTAPIQEEGKGDGPRNRKGTPQGGVISPLLANIYLHWFDRAFHAADGPARWAGAVLVRYADDFVVLARHMGGRIQRFIEEKVEGWLKLKINREKTRVVNLREQGARLDFLGYSFRWDRDRLGRDSRYWNWFPSDKSMKREREVLREMTGPNRCFVPVDVLIQQVNRHLRGWAGYFSCGYPRHAHRRINRYVRLRLTRHLRRRSQRAFQPPEGVSLHDQLTRLGLLSL